MEPRVSRRGLILGALAAPFVGNPAFAAIGSGFCPPRSGRYGGGAAGSEGYGSEPQEFDFSNVGVPTLTGTRTVYMRNVHTGESLAGEYLVDGQYVEGALQAFNRFARDHRNGQEAIMSAGLLDIVSLLSEMLGTGTTPWTINSAYRSPSSNATVGGARQSLHMRGKALDIAHISRSPSTVQGLARNLQMGGVGTYTSFTHVDTGQVRNWRG